MDEDTYFIESHNGHWIEDFILSDKDGYSVEVYECRVCFALVKDPNQHIEWHKGKTL